MQQTARPHRMRPAGPKSAAKASAKATALIPGPLIYGGGVVQSAPRVYVVFWGWNSDPSGEQGYLTAFLSRIGGTPWLNTVGQYSGGSPVNLFAGAWSDPTPVPVQPTDAQIQHEAFSAIRAMNVPYSFNSQVIVAMPTGHNPAGFDSGTKGYCAYHSVLSNTDVTYTALPYITDAGHDCGENSVNPGSAGVLDGVSIVEGHELAETITDPLINAWLDGAGYEIGDKCAWYGLRDITASGSTFAVQSLWSNATNSCVNAAPRWTDWANEFGAPPPGVAPGSAPVVSTSGANRLDVFVRGNDDAIWTESWNGSGWSGWQSLGGNLVSNPGVVAGGPNPIDLFAVGSNGDIWHRVYSSGTWAPWGDELRPPPPGIAAGASPTLSTSGPNRLDVFVRGADNAIWDQYWNGSGWSGWQSLGGNLVSNPGAVAGGPNPIDLFAVGRNGDIWHNVYTSGTWLGWNDELQPPPPGVASGASVSVATWGGNRLDVFVRGADNAIWHIFWNGVGWNGWQSLGPIITSDPGAVGRGPNIFDLFGIGTDGSVWHKYYTNPS
ncbi:hypothetical protein KGA66_27385 [Actinocrinis puniceicyclus]|uniref:PLL-like beta propeller domain-containing protein n=1 Tax=Actinocrinis puniceicyclus TaxID=977794 RepID=A0A8J8BFM1_9ACTN|nr:hypothetical protein [Actinocrinis puniceicyclus]MBS2966790.1 hypothetical protein [Actinocrinis puniceicyclus]